MIDALREGGKPALARALARLEAKPGDAGTAALLDAAWSAPRGWALGLTGPPGVGKSTLTGALLKALRGDGLRVGIIAIDPSSRRTGGALLGDRARLRLDPEDDGVFFRSMAARDRLGGVAALTFPALVLMRALYDIVIVETVGVGQSETEIVDIADMVMLCAQPGAGDGVQFMKAGVMETPDVAVVTKADMGAPARAALAQMKGALSLSPGGESVATLACSASSGEGVEALVTLLRERAGGAGWTGRRRTQLRLWAERAVQQEAGRFGRARLAQTLSDAPFARRPFAAVAAGLAQLERLLAESSEAR